MTIVVVYVVCALLTVMRAAYEIGKEQGRIKILQPKSFSQVNWVNLAVMTVVWPAFWAAKLATHRVRNETRIDAADALGIPREDIVQ
jgi:hypothetical protein